MVQTITSLVASLTCTPNEWGGLATKNWDFHRISSWMASLSTHVNVPIGIYCKMPSTNNVNAMIT